MPLERTRFQGCLAGLATGDALGTTVEFRPPGTFEPVTDMTGGGVFALVPGQWTDDTSMALCLAESLLELGSFNPADQMDRYLLWFREGHLSSTGSCFDIGNATRDALLRYEATGRAYSGSEDPRSAGNGSIMRLAPAVLFRAGNPAAAIREAALSSRTTHAASECLDACRLMAAVLLGALNGLDKEALLDPQRLAQCLKDARIAEKAEEAGMNDGSGTVPDYGDTDTYGTDLSVGEGLLPSLDAIRLGSYRQLQPPDIQGSGYVVKSLEAALWAFWHSGSFAEGALLAVNLGDDADTTGAVYGQIAGAYYGVEGIPPEWLAKLAMRERILDDAVRLYRKAEAGAAG